MLPSLTPVGRRFRRSPRSDLKNLQHQQTCSPRSVGIRSRKPSSGLSRRSGKPSSSPVPLSQACLLLSLRLDRPSRSEPSFRWAAQFPAQSKIIPPRPHPPLNPTPQSNPSIHPPTQPSTTPQHSRAAAQKLSQRVGSQPFSVFPAFVAEKRARKAGRNSERGTTQLIRVDPLLEPATAVPMGGTKKPRQEPRHELLREDW